MNYKKGHLTRAKKGKDCKETFPEDVMDFARANQHPLQCTLEKA